MYYDVLEARYIEEYKLELVFEKGKKGIIDLSKYRYKGGVFSRFSDIEYFKQFYVNKEIGTLCWPDGLDIAPETLYHEATGEPLPAWMRPERAVV
ncbi:MAG TPA: DUF2442 domain-containing protein [Thermodesulfovibrionales bacterium]|jgi:hypothetical protein|nr:DUF2442 domain-containing protein [Thermodesulfovibrionales bacterium]